MRKFKEIKLIDSGAQLAAFPEIINEIINRINLYGELITEILDRHPNISVSLPPRVFDKWWNETELEQNL